MKTLYAGLKSTGSGPAGCDAGGEGGGAAALSPQGKLLLPLLSKFVGTLQGLMKDQAKLVIASNGSGCWDLGHRMYLELTSASCPPARRS